MRQKNGRVTLDERLPVFSQTHKGSRIFWRKLMNYKIDIAGTSIALNVSRNDITVTNGIKYDIQMQFRNLDSDTSLDTEGDVFEPLYWLDVKVTPKEPTEYHSSLGVKAEKRNLAELQKFFEFIENNKRNLFDLCGFKGELQ